MVRTVELFQKQPGSGESLYLDGVGVIVLKMSEFDYECYHKHDYGIP